MNSYITKGRVAVASCVALLGAACYGVIVYPMKHAQEYMRIQDEVRQGIDREQIQPGGMRIWSDPFKERVKEEPLYLQKLRKERGG
ncbi:small integral membrane protein 20-like [Thrips palmi]|uniref:Small integral membrane protein 20-like n=1 Tax=Thrips palmi TaxID=161013 RepID=A0A6P9A009_THRPL|nr:small integral membrane protein 20-like [Thrips palmi]